MVIRQIDRETFKRKSEMSRDDFLLCFQTSSTSDINILEAIEECCSKFPQEIPVYTVAENDLEFFQHDFDFWGTPIYIFIKKGRECGRLFGKISKESMVKFLVSLHN